MFFCFSFYSYIFIYYKCIDWDLQSNLDPLLWYLSTLLNYPLIPMKYLSILSLFPLFQNFTQFSMNYWNFYSDLQGFLMCFQKVNLSICRFVLVRMYEKKSMRYFSFAGISSTDKAIFLLLIFSSILFTLIYA